MEIGWIGLGSIGTQMVKQVLGRGFKVQVYERGQGLEEVLSAGAQAGGDYTELAADSDVLIVCVFSDAQLKSILQDHGALAAMRPGSTLVVHTTGSPKLMRALAEAAPEGVAILDATFSGGPADVEAARLALMVGGGADVLERVRPLLECYADRIHPVGALGNGQMLKLLNNLLFAVNLQNAAEILGIAQQQGFETSIAARVIQACSGASYANGLFQDGMPVQAMLEAAKPYLAKDVETALSTAEDLGIDVSAFEGSRSYYNSASG